MRSFGEIKHDYRFTDEDERRLALLKPLGLSQYGPEQVRFLRYRPVLDNRRLKEVFGYTPRLTSSETFDLYRRARSRSGAA